MEFANYFAATWAMPLLFLMSLIVTIIVSVNSHRTSIRLTQLEMLRGVDQQWQTLNSAILSRPDIQRHINPEQNDVSEREIVRKNVVFYVLNLELQIQRSCRLKIIDPLIAQRFQREHVQFLRNLKTETLEICANSDVYRSEIPDLIESLRKV
ncbi:hypothetical protein [Undibacterium sp. SXout20W]|uniref:hypothetical protein n=1 Tax=Undibacterium sp. SXout20W TaxID=3413051 RepID=UPI003BEFE65F